MRNGGTEVFNVGTIDDARGIINNILNKYQYVEEVVGQTYGAITSFNGYNDPDETGYVSSETWSVWKDCTILIDKTKEILRNRVGDELESIEEGIFRHHHFCADDEPAHFIRAILKDGSVEEFRLYSEPNALWLAVESNDDVKSLELYIGDPDDPEYVGVWNVINGEIQW